MSKENTLYFDLFGTIDNEGCPETYIDICKPDDEILGLSTIDGIIIKRKITTVNRTTMTNKVNLYIVIHYVGAVSTAANNASYFYSVNRGASAGYFVDPDEIWQVVEDYDAGWHCGGGLQSNKGGTFYNKCKNSNSIGIELCMKYKNRKAYFEEGTIKNAISLVKMLMKKYNIPVNRVIRHYDVVGKYCPGPYVDDENAWNDFKSRLTKEVHWGEKFYNEFKSKGFITDDSWRNYEEYVSKSHVIALVDKITGGKWDSPQANPSIHWVQPHVISLIGKGYIDPNTKDEIWLTNPDALISKALLLALINNMTGGILDLYKNRIPDHWARNCLDSLCDKTIVNSPQQWTDFECPPTKALTMALLSKAISSGKIR